MGDFHANKHPMIRLDFANSLLRSPVASLFLLLAFTCSGAAQEFVTGKVLEKVATRKDDKQTYALYLPTSYTPAKRFPIIYAFDPGARGALPDAQRVYITTAVTLTLAAEIRPDNPQLFFGIARAQALARNRKDAIEALKKAVEKGSTNLDELKNNPDLETVRGEQAYKQLIESLSKKNANASGASNGGENHKQ